MKSRTQRPAERPEIISLATLLKVRNEARKGSLLLKVRIPAKVVPLFNALVELTEADSPEAFAAWAICKGLTSEEAISKFDDLVNALL